MLWTELVLLKLFVNKFSFRMHPQFNHNLSKWNFPELGAKFHPCSPQFIPSVLNLLNSSFIWEAFTFKPYNVILKITVVSLIISSFFCHYLYGCDEGETQAYYLHAAQSSFVFPFFRLATTARGGSIAVKRDLRPCKLWFLENDGILGSIMPGLWWGDLFV